MPASNINIIMNITSFHSLPVEILLLIADQLSIGDCYHCSHVSRQWYRIFRPRLYRSVDIHDSKTLECFMQMISKEQELQGESATASLMFLPVSRCVKAIELSNVEIPKELKEIPVQSLAWRYVDPLMSMINQTMAYYGGITSLTLKFTKNEATPSFDIYILIRQMPRLKSLALSGLFKELATDDLEELQNQAPESLMRLDLEGDTLATDNHWGRSNPSSSIQDLRLAYRWPNARNSAMWLMYLTRKYPHVRRLQLEGRKGAATVVSTSSRLSGRGDEEQDLMEVDPLCIQACNIFSRSHPDLEHVRLVNLGLHPSLYQTMLSGLNNCRDIDLAGVEAPLSYSSEEKQQWLEDLFASFQGRVERLNIKLVYPRIVMLGLSRCKNLRQLTLSRTSGFITSRDHHWQLSLSNLLKSCPRLDDLTLRQLTVASPISGPTNDTNILHPLRVLRLEHVALPASALQSLGTQCHQLCQLYIHHCKWLSQNHQLNHVGLYMSEQTLDLVEIIRSGDVYTLEPHNLLTIHTTSKHHWYLNTSSLSSSTTPSQPALSQANTWSQIRSMVNVQKLEYMDEYNVTMLEQHMEELAIARAQRTSTSSTGPYSHIKTALSHGYLAFHCKSIDKFYFNGTKVCL
ncbi:hypothetical protein BDA99DRAFT_541136 [Phascolomyces articulosus]|uniref:F-box domain-containing protein n=1 Tax=Phascolomyces articulosus TaxID=60185 RepID=A0AAD5JSM7_9FUNG|nr:hypothetical protein BDA99DRAFT_541136 [Phascolomyces articulosus]